MLPRAGTQTLSNSFKPVSSSLSLVFACILFASASSSRAAEANLEVLPSWNGTGKVGYRAGLQFGVTGVIQLGGGVAYLPDEVVVGDLTAGIRVGDTEKFWAELETGPAWSSSKTIDTRDIGSNFMFHSEGIAGYKWLYVGFTHYSNLYIRSPNMGANFVTIGVRIPLAPKP